MLRTVRFLKMAALLPLELQMLLSNRVFELTRDLIPSRDSDLAFTNIAREYQQKTIETRKIDSLLADLRSMFISDPTKTATEKPEIAQITSSSTTTTTNPTINPAVEGQDNSRLNLNSCTIL